MTTTDAVAFSDLALDAAILETLDDVGYETPSPIQAETIPLLLDGRDVVGQAQTGTGKTAAFALPTLSNIDPQNKGVQALVLAPTRELAIQVAEAFQKYASNLKGFHVLPIYGGQEFRTQLRALERGVHVVVGTPGRVMDHMRRRTLKLDQLKTLVLDEADEMLRMGFIDDVDWILEQLPKKRQIALFSATMPKEIRNLSTKYLDNPAQVTIKVKTQTADTINQSYWMLHGAQKLDALTRVLESRDTEGVLVFVRTKSATAEIAEKLQARGYAAAALSGDVAQNIRERTVDRLKKGTLDIVVATDVAARGLDVERISHVINYDIPHDTESYVHRIGRTGRAGRTGEAILFVTPREKRLLFTIEKATRQKIKELEFPSVDGINKRRIAQFKKRIAESVASGKSKVFRDIVEQYAIENELDILDVAAALAQMVQGETPLLLDKNLQHQASSRGNSDRPRNESFGRDRGRGGDKGRDRPRRDDRGARGDRPDRGRPQRDPRPSTPDAGMDRFRIEVGRAHNVAPGNIMGAIANEAGLDGKDIGRINIYDNHSEVDLPEGMPKDVFNDLKKVRVGGQRLNISKADGRGGESERPSRPPRPTSGDRDRPRSNSDGDDRKRSFSKKPDRKRDDNKKPFVKKTDRSDDDKKRTFSKKTDRPDDGANKKPFVKKTDRPDDDKKRTFSKKTDRPDDGANKKPFVKKTDRPDDDKKRSFSKKTDRPDDGAKRSFKKKDSAGSEKKSTRKTSEKKAGASTIGLGKSGTGDVSERTAQSSFAKKRSRRKAVPRNMR